MDGKPNTNRMGGVSVGLAALVMLMALAACSPRQDVVSPEQAVSLDSSLTPVLTVIAEPADAARFLLNPDALGIGGYARGITVTIDVLPKAGWEISQWAGPVYDTAGKTAKIDMDVSQTVVVRLVNRLTARLYSEGTASNSRESPSARPPSNSPVSQTLPPFRASANPTGEPAAMPGPAGSGLGAGPSYAPVNHEGALEITSNQSVAQTFTVDSTGTLAGAEILGINRRNCAGDDGLHVRLIATAQGAPSSLVFYEETLPPESIPKNQDRVQITFGPNGWPVGRYEILVLELSTDAPPEGCSYIWDGDSPGNYPDGETYIAHQDGLGWDLTSQDMGFRVFMAGQPR